MKEKVLERFEAWALCPKAELCGLNSHDQKKEVFTPWPSFWWITCWSQSQDLFFWSMGSSGVLVRNTAPPSFAERKWINSVHSVHKSLEIWTKIFQIKELFLKNTREHAQQKNQTWLWKQWVRCCCWRLWDQLRCLTDYPDKLAPHNLFFIIFTQIFTLLFSGCFFLMLSTFWYTYSKSVNQTPLLLSNLFISVSRSAFTLSLGCYRSVSYLYNSGGSLRWTGYKVKNIKSFHIY